MHCKHICLLGAPSLLQDGSCSKNGEFISMLSSHVLGIVPNEIEFAIFLAVKEEDTSRLGRKIRSGRIIRWNQQLPVTVAWLESLE